MGKVSKKKAKKQPVKQRQYPSWLRYWPQLSLALLVLGTFLLRTIPQWSKVFINGEVWFRAVDPWFHMRLVDNMMVNWPLFMSHDMYAAYPGGSSVGFYPLMAWIITSFGKLGLNYEVVGALLPPILGALILIPVYFLGRELFGRGVALVGCLLVALLPTELFHRSLLGFTDHHILESFLMVTVVLFLILAFRRNKWRYIISAGVVLGLYLLNWHGSAFFLFILGVAFFAEFVHRLYKEEPLKPICKAMFATMVIALGISLPYVLIGIGRNMSLLTSAILVVLTVALWGLTPIIKSKKKFLIAAGATAAVGIVGLNFLAPILLGNPQANVWRLVSPAFWGGGTWIGEAQPLYLELWFPVFGISLFMLLGGLFFAARRRVSPFFIVWAVFLVLATIGQRRWGYYSVIPIGLLASYFMFEIGRLVKPDAKAIVIGVMCLFAIVPSIQGTIGLARIANNIQWDWHIACEWLEENTPDPFASDQYYGLNVEEKPEYGILSWWDYGHWIIRLGHRVPLTSPTRQGVQEESWFLVAQTDEEAEEAIEGLNIKYVMVDEDMITGKFYAIVQKAGYSLEETEKLHPNSMAVRLWYEQTDSWQKVYEVGRVKIYERVE